MRYHRHNIATLNARYPGLLALLLAAGARWDGDTLEFDPEAMREVTGAKKSVCSRCGGVLDCGCRGGCRKCGFVPTCGEI